MRRSWALFGAFLTLAWASICFAQQGVTVQQLPSVPAALGPGDVFWCGQGTRTYKCTINQAADYLRNGSNTWVGVNTFSGTFRIGSTTITGATGSGNLVLSDSPTFGTPGPTIGSIILPHGSGVLTPPNGSLWTTTAGLFARINGANVGPLLAPSDIGSTVEAWDADLDALAALSTTNAISYRSGAGAWSAVTIGPTADFTAGVLSVLSAPKWTTARTLSFIGDATGSGSVDGSAGVATTLTFATVATPGTAMKITFNAKGLVTSGATAACADLSNASPSCATDATNATNITSGTLPAARIPATAVTAASYGDSTHVGAFTVGADGRLTAASSVTITAGGIGGVTTTGSPAANNLTCFSAASTITNCDLSGDISTSGTSATTIGANKVTNAMFRQSGSLALVGRSANSTGNVADIQATAATDSVLRESGSTIGFGTIASGGIANSAVTLAKIANIADQTILGNNTGGSAAPVALTAAQTLTVLGAVNTSGTPASGKLTKFSGAATVTNGDLSGDCATSGTLVTACSVSAMTGTLPVANGGTGSTTAAGGGANLRPVESLIISVGDETTAITAGTGKITFRMPYAFTVTAVRASLTTAQASGSIFTVDINEAGTTILSTKLTIDNTETTSTTAVTPPVISDTSLADDAQMTVDVDQIGDGTAKGLKVVLIGNRT